MHPRNTIRNELKAIIEGVVNVPVFASRARDLPPNTRGAVVVYVGRESLRRLDERPGAPVARQMVAEIVVLVEGTDEAGSEVADEISRSIEVAISKDYAHAAPVSAEVSYNADSKRVKTLVITSYSIEIQDAMEA